MLINLSNHPSSKWDSKQKQKAVEIYGQIIDLSFPAIDPHWDTNKVKALALDYYRRITLIFDQCANEPQPNAVHIQGEFTFVYKIVTLLKTSHITCVASTSVRNVIEKENGEKIVRFNFVQFREY